MQLEQLLQNLVANALKFRGDGRRAVRVLRRARRARDGADRGPSTTGIGIEPQHRERVFKMFQRLHDRESLRGHGHRPGDLPQDRRAPRRADLGRGPRGRRDALSASRSRRRADGAARDPAWPWRPPEPDILPAMADVAMPRLSDSMEEGTILKWLKSDGDEVEQGRGARRDRDGQGQHDVRGRRGGDARDRRPGGRHAPGRRDDRADRRGVGGGVGRLGRRLGRGRRRLGRATTRPSPTSDEDARTTTPRPSPTTTTTDDDAGRRRRGRATRPSRRRRRGRVRRRRPDDDEADAESDRRRRRRRQGRVAGRRGRARRRRRVVRQRAGEGVADRPADGARDGARARGRARHRAGRADRQGRRRGGGARRRAAAGRGAAGPPKEEREAAPAAQAAPRDGDGGRGEVTHQDLSRLQRTVARRMAESKATAPDFVISLEVDMEDAVELRKQLKAAAGDEAGAVVQRLRRQGERAGAARLPARQRRLPRRRVRALLARERRRRRGRAGRAGRARRSSTPTRRAWARSPPRPAGWPRRCATARSRRPSSPAGRSPSRTSACTASATWSPVINPPQAAILGVGELTPRPVVRDGEIVVRRVMELTLVCDHRILYGADAAQFLGEDPRVPRDAAEARALAARAEPEPAGDLPDGAGHRRHGVVTDRASRHDRSPRSARRRRRRRSTGACTGAGSALVTGAAV